MSRTIRSACIASLLLAVVFAPAAHAKFKDLTPVADAQVESGDPNANKGAATSFFVQSADSSNQYGDERAWLRFDLNDQIPAGATISSAKLRIYAFQADSSDDLVIDVAPSSDDSWSETGITWNNQPAIGGVLSSATLESPKTYLWYEFDVTPIVQSEFGGDGLVSLVVKPQTEGTTTWKTYRFNSREYIRDGYSLIPKLRIEFDGAWPSAGAINVIHTNDIHSRLTTHDLDFPDADGESPALEEAGGAAHVAAKVVELKKANPDSLYLDAGDISEGNPLGDLRGNGGTVDFFQALNAELKGLPGNIAGRGVDAVVVGNHDVRELAMLENMKDPDGDGIENTPAYPTADPDDVPYLAVNIVNESGGVPTPGTWPSQMPFRPYVVIDVNGTKVGVLGYLTDDSAILTAETEFEIDVFETAWTDKDNGAPTTDVVYLKDWVEHLRKPAAQGGEEVDVVVLLSHIGHRRLNSDGDVGFGDGNDELLGDQGDVAPPDLVVSGHWHTWAASAWQPNTLNYKTTNVEAASYGQYVGDVQITPTGRYVGSTKHPIRVSDFTIPHPDSDVDDAYSAIASLLSSLESEYDALSGPEHDCSIDAATIQAQPGFSGYVDGHPCPLDYIVGYSAVDLTLDKDKWNTLSEFPWSGDNTAGEWIADGMVWKINDAGIAPGAGTYGNTANPSPAAANPDSSYADLAIQSGGGIRRDIAAGPVTYREIFETYPWSDDQMVRVQMSSQDIWNYVEGHFVGSSLSRGWQVSAEDGIVSSITYDHDANPGTVSVSLIKTDDTTLWNVIISEYMYQHDDWINETGGTDDSFAVIDDTPDPLGLGIRDDAVVPYTAQFDDPVINAMPVEGPRYVLNTEVAGEFEAVVTMTADAETQPYFEGVFVRLLNATSETLWRRDLPGDPYGLTDLVNADGTINPAHEFAETLLYRSHLGFPDGYLQVGDRLIVNGEFGFFEGNAQFVDQDGIVSAETEFDLLGNAPLLAMPNYFPRLSDFMIEAQENRLIKFYARRTGDNTIEDAAGESITVYREGGFFSSSTFLPGVNGDCLELIGVSTERADASPDRRFRLREAVANPFGGSTCFPPASTMLVTGDFETGSQLTLTASGEDLNGFSGGVSGGWYFAGMDLDGEGATLPLSMAISGIDITGQAGLTFRALVAEDDEGSNQDWDNDDYVRIKYQIDGGGYQDLLHFENDGSTYNSAPFVDTNFDGDGDGTEVTETFTAFTAAIAGTGSTLDIGIEFQLDSGDEDIAFDDIEILNGAQSSLFLEDFEDATVGYTTSIPEFSDGSGDFFVRTDGSDHGGFVSYQSGTSGGSQQYGTITQVAFYVSTDGGETFSLIGTDSTTADGFTMDYTPTIEGEYEFYSIATDDDGLSEMAPAYADAIVSIANAPTPVPVRVPLFGMGGQAALALLLVLIGLIYSGLWRSRRYPY